MLTLLNLESVLISNMSYGQSKKSHISHLSYERRGKKIIAKCQSYSHIVAGNIDMKNHFSKCFKKSAVSPNDIELDADETEGIKGNSDFDKSKVSNN